MMILKRRCSEWPATCVAGILVFFVSMNPASGGIISDRSAFVGDFTVIDFETRADGTPLILDEGEIFGMFPQEYAAFGVTITSSGNLFGNDWPFISNARNAAFDRAHALAGSLHNTVSPGTNSDAYLRIDFLIPTNAIGLAAINRTDGPIVRLDAFNDRGELLESAFLAGALVDGTVRGEDFGSEFDIDYGFIGIFAPESEIAYATISTRITQLDDLHFGIIPEPTSGCTLCCALVLIVLGRRKFRALHGRLSALLVLVVILSLPSALRADETVIGTVTGWVMTSEDPICGDNGPGWCVQQPLASVPLHDVRVCVSGGACTFTDSQGNYDLLVSSTIDTIIEADLNGQWTKVGELEIEFPFDLIVSPPHPNTFCPEDPPTDNRIDFHFNPLPHNPVSEIPTVEANIFYHTMLVREFYLQRHPSFTGLNVQIASARNGAACTRAFFVPSALLMSFPESGSQSGTSCIAKADRSDVAHEYGHVIHNALGLDDLNTDETFREGFAETVALLVYDFPNLYLGHDGEGTFKSYDFAPPANAPRINWPCTTQQCPNPNSAEPEPNCCGSIRAGIWWDIKLNMQAKYTGVGAPDCPIDPALNESEACGLKLTRQLFVDWSKVTSAASVEFMLAEILDLDDDDGDLWNGSPNFAEICRAFRDHGIDCPFDCNEDGRHDLDNIVHDNLADLDENQVPDLCEGGEFGYKIVYVDAGAGGANNGSTWRNAFTSLRVAMQAVAFPADEIWVAAGKYRPSISGDMGKSFVLADGLRVYGGFEGGELKLTQRDPVENETILSGDLNGADCQVCPNETQCAGFGDVCVDGCCAEPDNGENSRTVVSASAVGSSANTLLDGFTITAGNGSIGFPGGMFISGRPTVRNCRFVGNLGGGNGGGAVAFGELLGAKPLFQNCRFENNSVVGSGGAVFFDSGSSPRFVDCWFVQNSATNEGGAVLSGGSSSTFIRCNFERNSANHGGAILIKFDPLGFQPSLQDCVFRDNSAVFDGGGLNIANSPATLSRCLFYGNHAGRSGGGMYNADAEKKSITDCIFGGNSALVNGGGIYNGGGRMDVVNTLIVGNETTGTEAQSEWGGGVYVRGNAHDKYVNCTIAHNRASALSSDGDGMYLESGSTADLTNCIFWANQGLDLRRTRDDQFFDAVQGSNISATIIDDGSGAGDPLFRKAKGADLIAGTEDDDFRLSAGSPAKDVGVNSFLPAGIATDLDGGPRIAGPIIGGEIIDLGPYEWSDCNNNSTDDGGDIFSGTSFDCNNNGLPDECDITNGTSEDCTNNLIPDECEPDCQAPGLPGSGSADSCDISNGTSSDLIGNDCHVCSNDSPDCDSNGGLCVDGCCVDPDNGDGIPDECQQDCNVNLIPDELELAGNDCNFNGVPDECDDDLNMNGVPDDCASPPLPATMGCDTDLNCGGPDPAGARCSAPTVPPTPRFCECPGGDDAACFSSAVCISGLCYVPRNKYVSFQTNIPQQANNNTAFRVKLIASASLPGCVDEIRWVGPPEADHPALLDDTARLLVEGADPFYSDNWPEVVHIADEEIAPDSTYEIVAVFQVSGFSSLGVEFPTVPKPGTKFWGDSVGSYNGDRWSPPNGVVNVTDIQAVIKTFLKKPNAPHVSMSDIHGTFGLPVPNRMVNANDILFFILAFKTEVYPWKVCGCDLPWTPPSSGPGSPSTLSLVLSSAIISPNETVDVDVFLDAAGDLAAYQLALEVTTGGVGTLDLESRFITARPDYVFDSMNSIELADDVDCHIVALDLDAVGVAVVSPVYLGTFRFRASSDAKGVFHIGFQGIEENFLTRSDGFGISNLITGVGVDIEIECDDDVDCDDGNECTDDTCVIGACSNVNDDTNTCTDGNDCTDDSCSSGVCVGVNDDSNTCSDGNECTDDSCSSGTCVSTNDNTNTCADGNDCTDDSCSSGVCVSTNDDTNTCTDGNDCTSDACVSGVCTGTNEPVGTSCDDGLFCTATDECDGSGTCAGSGDPCRGQNPYCCETLSTCTALPCS